MREILFRGQNRHGKWVQGWYCGKTLNIDMTETEDCNQIIDFNTLYWHVVKPETVGQFTGVTGKNSTKIFEGDIVLYNWYDDEPMKFQIEYVCGEFIAVPVEKRDDVWSIRISGQGEQFEVIGNIHDNPELLEVK